MEQAFRKMWMLVTVVLVLSQGNVMNAQICNMTLNDMRACQPSVASGSTGSLLNPQPVPVPAPTSQCCLAVSHANMSCVCSFKNSRFLPMMGIDPNLAMQLPQKCNLPPLKC